MTNILLPNGCEIEDVDFTRIIERYDIIDGKRRRFTLKAETADDISVVNCLEFSEYCGDGKITVRFGNMSIDNTKEVIEKSFKGKLNLMDEKTLGFGYDFIQDEEKVGDKPYLLYMVEEDDDNDIFTSRNRFMPAPANIFDSNPFIPQNCAFQGI